MTDNPLLATTGLPRFHEVQPDHVMPAVKAAITKIETDLAALEANATPTWAGVVEPFMRLGDELTYAWAPVGHLLSVCNTDELRAVHDEAQPLVVELSLKLGQSKPIFDALVALRDADEWGTLDAGQHRTVEKYIQAAERAGVGLEGDAKERFLNIRRELSQLGSDFSNHVLDATKAFELIITDPADAEGWPITLRRITSQSYAQANDGKDSTPEAGPWRVTLDFPSFGPFMQHSRSRAQREAVYRAFATRAASGDFDNSAIVEQTLKLEQEAAQLLGFETYARYSTDAKMAGTPERVYEMYDRLVAAAKPASRKEVEALRAFAAERGHAGELKSWDVAFWSERLREDRFQFTDEQLRPYFPMPRVLDGLFGLCTRLFGVTFEVVESEPTVWQEDVRYYRVFNEAGTEIAGFYLDPYSRPAEKRGGAWMNDCLGRRVEPDGSVRLPVAHLICNGTPPTGDTPSLMSFREVETLFHEFGHGLQHMLTTQPYAAVAGINGVEWDAVELASQFMENWCYEKPVLVGMTQHVETGEPLPDDLFNKLVEARTFMAGYGMMRQVTLGSTDLELYHRYVTGVVDDATAHDVEHRIAADCMPIDPLPEGRLLCSFGHIFSGGYSAGYYSYLWSEVLSADAFAAFEEAGLGDEGAVQSLGRTYRDTVLGLGGGLHPMDVYKAFRGREPDPTALLKHSGLLAP